MATSSIHIASGKAGYLSHNDRSLPTNNSIFKDEKNEVFLNNKEAFSIYREELATRSKAYSDRTHQKIQKNVVTHLSAIVNLNSNHTLKDLQPLIQHLETSLDTKVFQVAIHRDEGHIKDDKNIKNYHCHIEFMGLDSQGSSVRRKLTRSYLKDLQTKTADILQMKRGVKNSKAKRLDTYEFKNHKQREEKALAPVLASQKDLKQEIAILRAELKEQKATRNNYAQLEQLNKDLKEQISSKDLTLSELQEQLEQYKDTTDKTIEAYKQDIDSLKFDNRFLKLDLQLANGKKLDFKKKVVKPIEQNELKTSQNRELKQLLKNIFPDKAEDNLTPELILNYVRGLEKHLTKNGEEALKWHKTALKLQKDNEVLKDKLSLYEQDMELSDGNINYRKDVEIVTPEELSLIIQKGHLENNDNITVSNTRNNKITDNITNW